MKRLISAVTAVCMAATMYAAVPASAAEYLDSVEAEKTLSIYTISDFDNLDMTKGTANYTVSAEDIAAGDVVIHCGLYLGATVEAELSTIYCKLVRLRTARAWRILTFAC